MKKKILDKIDLSGSDGKKGIRLISARQGADLEIIKKDKGGASFEIKTYEEGISTGVMVTLTKNQIHSILKLFNGRIKKEIVTVIKLRSNKK